MVSSWHFVLKCLFILEPDIFWKITFSTVQDKIISYSKSRIEVFFFFFHFLGPHPGTYESSQARGQITAAAGGLRHTHSNARSELHLRPTP